MCVCACVSFPLNPTNIPLNPYLFPSENWHDHHGMKFTIHNSQCVVLLISSFQPPSDIFSICFHPDIHLLQHEESRSILGCAVGLYKWPTQHNNEDSPISIHLVRGFSQLWTLIKWDFPIFFSCFPTGWNYNIYYNNNSVLRIISRWGPINQQTSLLGAPSSMVFLHGFLWFIQVKPCEMPIFFM
jgi:hypothetical protein